jgi:hypothetical protein
MILFQNTSLFLAILIAVLFGLSFPLVLAHAVREARGSHPEELVNLLAALLALALMACFAHFSFS